jgi:hypothetical protein
MKFEEILPRYFQHTKLASFSRQLYMYGFRRIVGGPDDGAYYNTLFLRDRPHLCNTIRKPFIQALMDLLSQEDPEIVTWVRSGTAFIVRNPKKFVEMVLPRFSKQTKLASFYRQLNLYGFRRMVYGPFIGAYHHELFVRDKPHLCLTIQRSMQRGRGRGDRKRTTSISLRDVAASEGTVALSTADGNTILPPSPPAEAVPSYAHKMNSSSGYSIVVCDHAGMSMVEVANFATLTCDLQSFALGVSGLLTYGIELHKAANHASVNGTSSITTNNIYSELLENYDLMDYYDKQYDESGREQLDEGYTFR